jgi:CHAT domain-containing protein
VISYLPSLKAGINLHQRAKPPASGYCGLEASADLPLGEATINLICEQFNPSEVLSVRGQFDGDQFGEVLKRNQGTFQYSGHGEYNSEQPHLSSFWLPSQQRLTANEIYNKYDFSQYKRAILNACELGGTGRYAITTEYVGLGSVILAKGASYVISALWRVSSLSCLILMLRLFENLTNEGYPEPKALKEACCWLKEVSVGELKRTYGSQLQGVEATLRESQTTLINNELTAEIIQTFGNINEALTLLGDILNNNRDDHQPFKDPYHHAAFICQGLV